MPYATWRATGWAIEAGALGTLPRPRSHRLAELTIDDAVPDVLDSMIEVRHLAPGDAFVPCLPSLKRGRYTCRCLEIRIGGMEVSVDEPRCPWNRW